jgi:hypothetical protein
MAAASFQLGSHSKPQFPAPMTNTRTWERTQNFIFIAVMKEKFKYFLLHL